jgi:hypothetical protein
VDGGPGRAGGENMTRTSLRKGPFGWRVTPGDLQDCFSFLRCAAQLVQKGLSGCAYGPCTRRRLGRTPDVFRRKP